MNIGIIGAGHIGGTLTRRLTKLGHRVFVANSRGPQTLADLTRETGAEAVTPEQAARKGEVVIVAIALKNLPKLPRGLFKGVDHGVVVIDTCNYYPQQSDGRIDAIENGMPESRYVEQQLGHPVIKAFNTIYAQHLMDLGRAADTPQRIALPVAGDDEAAKAIVVRLVNQLGFDGVDASSLDESWRQQPGTPVYAKDFDAEGVKRALSQASRERKPEWRAQASGLGNLAKSA